MQIDSGVVAPDDRAFGLAQTALDELARMREAVSSGKGVPTARGLIARIHALVQRGGAAPPRPARAAPAAAPHRLRRSAAPQACAPAPARPRAKPAPPSLRRA